MNADLKFKNQRDYPRLKALVMANRSALSLDLVEMLRLAEDPMCPSEAAEAYKWATRFAIPLIAELRRRLENSAHQVAVDQAGLRNA
jgi:hypothetical protein